MSKHLFYSLLITFLILALAEFLRPGFATAFINTNILFVLLLISGVLVLMQKGGKIKEEAKSF